MTALLVLARAIHFASGMGLAGVVAFRRLVLRPGLAGAAESDFLAPFFRRLKRLFVCSAAGVLVSEIALFWITGSDMAGEPLTGPDLLTVLGHTQFGHVCLFRAGLLVVLGLLVVPLCRRTWTQRQPFPEMAAAFPAGLLLASNSLTGHATAMGIFSWRVGADAVHLLAVSVWPAGLFFFALFLSAAKEAPALAGIRGVAGRFSDVSFVAVMILLLTGALNVHFTVGHLSALLATPYGRWLSLKLSLFAFILFFAAWNRYRLVPALGREERLSSRHRLRRFVLVELALAILIIEVVSILGITPPPH